MYSVVQTNPYAGAGAARPSLAQHHRPQGDQHGRDPGASRPVALKTKQRAPEVSPAEEALRAVAPHRGKKLNISV